MLQPQVSEPISNARLQDAGAAHPRLAEQGHGGWATYELTRGHRWLEWLNASDIFGDIMVDYSYVECTSACIQALRAYEAASGGRIDIERAVLRGVDYMLNIQRADGAWEGSWGVCFTYGTWFGVCGLRAAGLPTKSPAIQKACDFLESKQLADGGWGELTDSCREHTYISTTSGQAVMTSWALLTLAKGGQTGSEPVKRGVDFLLKKQGKDGTWPTEHIAGIFNRTCSINYDNYVRIFPLWAHPWGLCGTNQAINRTTRKTKLA
ncbi:MAG: prenyltransferase/squalene oxidase repeat-containing protein [Myxococcota bacterium]